MSLDAHLAENQHKLYNRTVKHPIAFVYAHPIVDVPPWVEIPGPPAIYAAKYYSRVMLYTCWSEPMGWATVGKDLISGWWPKVSMQYKHAQEDVADWVPGVGVYYDCRSLAMLQENCCPQLLLEQED